MTDLKGKVIVVTGASAGIGKAIVENLVKLGAKVVGCARNIEKLNEIAKILNATGPGEVKVIKCDVSVENDVNNLFKFTEDNFGGIYGMINNAATFENEPLLTGSTEGWMKMLNCNVMGVAMCSREAIKLMKKHGVNDGHVVNVNSLSGHRVLPFPKIHFYSATKFGVTALTEGLRQELRAEKSHIRVTSVSPGKVRTDFANRDYPDPKDLAAYYAAFDPLQADDIAQAVIYAMTAPPRVDISEMYIRSVEQVF